MYNPMLNTEHYRINKFYESLRPSRLERITWAALLIVIVWALYAAGVV